MFFTTFYSYKGGVGRSMALANLAHLLAEQGHPPVLWDFDLEAPGLHEMPFAVNKVKKGMLDFINDYLALNPESKVKTGAPTQYPDLIDYLTPIEYQTSKGPVPSYLFSVGSLGDAYFSALNQLNWAFFYDVAAGFDCFQEIKRQLAQLKPGFSYTLIDARTGYGDTRNICTIQLPDLVVLVHALNSQNLKGTAAMYHGIKNNQTLRQMDRTVDIKLLASMVPFNDSEEKQELLDLFASQMEPPVATIFYNAAAALKEKLICRRYPASPVSQEYEKLYQAVIKADPNSLGGLIERARDAFWQGDSQRVLALLKENFPVATPESRYKDAYLLLAQASFHQGDTQTGQQYEAVFEDLGGGSLRNLIQSVLSDRVLEMPSSIVPSTEPMATPKVKFRFLEEESRQYLRSFTQSQEEFLSGYVDPSLERAEVDEVALKRHWTREKGAMLDLVRRQHCLLIGDPGAGKTMMLRHLGVKLSKEYFPVFLPFNRLDAHQMIALFEAWGEDQSQEREAAFQLEVRTVMVEFIRQSIVPFLPEKWELLVGEVIEQLRSGQFLFLFDGLNEIAAGLRPALTYGFNFLMEQSKSHRIVCCSRRQEVEGLDLPFQRFRLTPWINQQQGTFLKKKFKVMNRTGYTTFFKGLPDEVRELARTPIILDMISNEDFQIDSSEVLVKGAVYHRVYSRKLEEYFRGDPTFIEQARLLLGTLAQQGLGKEMIGRVPLSTAEEVVEIAQGRLGMRQRLFDLPGLIKAGVDMGIFTNTRGDSLEFFHQSVQEYFAALYFFDHGLDPQVAESTSLTYWDQVFQIYCGLESNATGALLRIKNLKSRRFENSKMEQSSEAKVPVSILIISHCLSHSNRVDDHFWDWFCRQVMVLLGTQWAFYFHPLEKFLAELIDSLRVDQVGHLMNAVIRESELELLVTRLERFRMEESLQKWLGQRQNHAHTLFFRDYGVSERLDMQVPVEILRDNVTRKDFFGLSLESFLSSLATSVSLTVEEKLRICQSLGRLSRFQVTSLIEILNEETIKFATLDAKLFDQLVSLNERHYFDLLLYPVNQRIQSGDVDGAFEKLSLLISQKNLRLHILKTAYELRDSFSDEQQNMIEEALHRFVPQNLSDYTPMLSFCQKHQLLDDCLRVAKEMGGRVSSVLDIRNTAIAFWEGKERELAVLFLEEKIKKMEIDSRSREQWKIYHLLVRYLTHLGQVKHALELLLSIVDRYERKHLHLVLAQTQVELKLFVDALQSIEVYLKSMRSVYDMEDGDTQESVFDDLAPVLAAVLLNLDQLKKYKEYCLVFGKVSDFKLSYAMGQLLYDLGAYRKAIKFLDEARRRDSTNSRVIEMLEICYRHDHKFNIAAEMLENYLYLVGMEHDDPEEVIGLNNLGFYHFRLGKYQEAESYLRRDLENRPESLVSLGNLGHTLLMQGREDEARECYDTILEKQADPKQIKDVIIDDLEQLTAEFKDNQRVADMYRNYLARWEAMPQIDDPSDEG